MSVLPTQTARGACLLHSAIAAVVCFVTLAFAGCQMHSPAGPHRTPPSAYPYPQAAAVPAVAAVPPGAATMAGDLPSTAYTGYPRDGYSGPEAQRHCDTCGPPLPCNTFGPWRPPGIGGTWPPDEYICDGGGSPQIRVRENFQIEGLNPEETIGHFDTLEGRTIVEPTNKVCIYAPRFAAVRKVAAPFNDQTVEGVVKIHAPIGPQAANERNVATTAMQPLQPLGDIADRGPIGLIERQPGIVLTNEQIVASTRDRYKAYEDISFIRSGVLQEEDKPILAQRVQAAIAWTVDQGLQVEIAGQRATATIGDQRAKAVFEVDVPNHPRLQICKIASTDNAKPGEIVDFTIRFDNIGDQKMGNVTIVDNLTTRLEFVPGSAQSSLDASFSTQPNEVGSLVLRWEITKPIAPGKGGVVRFQCRVR